MSNVLTEKEVISLLRRSKGWCVPSPLSWGWSGKKGLEGSTVVLIMIF
jgi:hypothetical protein